MLFIQYNLIQNKVFCKLLIEFKVIYGNMSQIKIFYQKLCCLK